MTQASFDSTHAAPAAACPNSLIALGAIYAGLVFALDLLVPLGVASGMLYIIPILLSFVLASRRATYFVALVATLLTVCGYFLSPQGGTEWMALTNRLLALAAIWASAVLRQLVCRESAAVSRDSEQGVYGLRI